MEFETHPTLHLKCHHQNIFSKLSLKIKYHFLCTREFWDYKRASTDLIKGTVMQIKQ